MGFIDDALTAIAPKWSYKRKAWHIAANELRNYDAGNGDRLNAGWRVGNSSANEVDAPARDVVRARSRDMERNSDILAGILGALERNVVGWGLQLQARTGDDALDDRIEMLFEDWQQARNCDVTGMQTFGELCQMIVTRKYVDGAVLLVKRYLPGRTIPFCLQVLEVDELSGETARLPTSTNRVVGGIELNEWNQPVGYWVRQYSVDRMMPVNPIFLPAKDVIYYFKKRRPSQLREMPQLTTTVPRIRDSETFLEAVSVKERIAASLAVFIKKQQPVGGLGRGSPRSLKDIATGYDGKTIAPGMISELNPGDEIATVTPPSQGQNAAEIIRLQQRLAGAAQGIGYETASRDMSMVNYSSARQGLLEDKLTYEMERQSLIDHVLREVYETFVISAVLSGALELPDFWPRKREYMRHEWVAQGKGWIDPLKEVNANKIALQTGQKTFRDLAGASGNDWRDVLRQIAEERAYMDELGLESITTGGKMDAKSQFGNTDPRHAGHTDAQR